MHNLEVPENILDIENQIKNIRKEKELKVSEQLFEKAAVLRDREKKLLQENRWILQDYLSPL